MTNTRRRTAARARGLLDALELSFLDALRTPDGSEAPAALLWADPDRQWADLVTRLQLALPHLFVLGPYAPDKRTGPAIWLRCVVDRVAVPDVDLRSDVTPMLYLPGVARQSLREGDDCPASLQPLVELQFRGRVWHQRNGQDWTVNAFLVSEDGVGLDIAQDARTLEALHRSLPLLAQTPLEGLYGRRLDADDFDRLAISDPIRDVLRWMGAGDAFRTSEGDARWRSFCSVCIAEFKFDPDKKAPSDGAAAIVDGTGKWEAVWQRFKEAPKLYPDVATLLRENVTPLLHRGSERDASGNNEAEQQLRIGLASVADTPHAGAIATITALEAEHGKRREWVWAQLGESPLASALAPLAGLASAAASPLGGPTIEDVVSAYTNGGWRCDRSALEALASAKAPADVALVQSVVRALYLPWLDASARHFQSLILAAESTARSLVSGSEHEKDSCLLFADGLRYDVAEMLAERLAANGLRTRLRHRLAPLPTVTATAKPLASLSYDRVDGGEDSVDFRPRMKAGAQPADPRRLREEMAARGLDLLGGEVRPAKVGTTGGWLETGHLDELGHKLGIRLASQIETELDTLVDEVTGLLDAGWTRIRVVTDHGWLLMPGGLPYVAVPGHLTATKWSRCATVKGEAKPSVPVYSWHWNPHVRIASPHGAGSFAPHAEYSHGGISPQECIVPELVVERGVEETSASITAVSWRGMRCRVTVATNAPTVRIDLRLNWKQADTSIVASTKEVGPAGEVSLTVADDAHEGAAATIVAVDATGTVLDRRTTTVGEVS